MRTFPGQMSNAPRIRGWQRHALRGGRGGPSPSSRSGQEGFLLVEVMISALLVALIVVATFNGFAVANKASTNARQRDQAALLAAQSQEQLRSEPATALDVLEQSPHTYTTTIGSIQYTTTQEAKPLGASGSTTGCNVSETKASTGANFLVISTVSWPTQEQAKRPPVKQSSVITPPTGSDIEVDVVNGAGTGVAGVTARATFVPVESGSYNTVEATTGREGCVVLTGIQATEATVEIEEKIGFVTPSGALKPPLKELSIAPNITTHYEVQFAEGGRIAARYTYKGETSWDGKAVKSDTFVAANNGKMKVEPEYEIGSTAFASCEGSEEQSKATTGLYAEIAETAACTKYPHGDLFPFTTPWLVYPGDCSANKNAESESSALVTSGATTKVNVPLAYTDLVLYNGTYGKTSAVTEALGPVKIKNSECASAPTPDNSWGFTYVHEQTGKTLAKETYAGEGRLENPFQPFGTLSLCLVDATTKKTYTTTFTNSKVATPSTPTIYLGQKTPAEQEAGLEPYKGKIATLQSAQTTEEAAKKTREEKEATERSTWASERSSRRISESTYNKDISEQTKKREEKETTEKTNEAKRLSEIKTYETDETPAKEAATEENKSGVTVKAETECH